MDDDPANMINEGPRRRFDVDVLIKHPTMTPSEITARLGIEPRFSHCVGDKRFTPIGTPLEGVYPDTRWRHSLYFECFDQWFLFGIEEMIEDLTPHASFFAHLRETGGNASFNVNFLGDGYFGDNLPWQTLARLTELQLDFGIQCFDVPQNENSIFSDGVPLVRRKRKLPH